MSSDDLTRWARRGSVSAARSFHGGFVELFREGDSYASQLMPEQDWPLDVHIAITSSKRKSVGSSAGMKTSAEQCPYYPAWIETQDADLDEARQAILSKDFDRLAAITEASCLKMHSVMIATPPGLLYWNSGTLDLIHRIRELRSQGVGVTYTIDAGPQLKVICEPDNSHKVKAALEDATCIERVIHAGLGGGPRGRATMKSFMSSAPGKLVLFGEYAVLEGASALVCAVDRRARIRYEASDSPTL